MSLRDYALTQNDEDYGVVVHRPDCPTVQQHRVEGRPIATMFGVSKPLPPHLKRHDCLEEG